MRAAETALALPIAAPYGRRGNGRSHWGMPMLRMLLQNSVGNLGAAGAVTPDELLLTHHNL